MANNKNLKNNEKKNHQTGRNKAFWVQWKETYLPYLLEKISTRKTKKRKMKIFKLKKSFYKPKQT